ncbi:hypothetical protein KSS87_014602 [Heliosperma pusillum]|nr:hypothetical protein KSS87_014602 [Heliosperma pusillum]
MVFERRCCNNLCRLRSVSLFLFCLLCLSLLPFLSGISESRRMVIGSRPPRCTNRCMNCRPCMAVLVIPPHRLSPHEEENYYLLSWKCRCHNKLFQP